MSLIRFIRQLETTIDDCGAARRELQAELDGEGTPSYLPLSERGSAINAAIASLCIAIDSLTEAMERLERASGKKRKPEH